MLFQLQLSGTGLRDCQEWVVSIQVLDQVNTRTILQYLNMTNNLIMQGIATSAKLNDITNAVVLNINQHCHCGLGAEYINEGAFQCFESSEQQVTVRARLHGTSQVTSLQLLSYLEIFVARSGSTIAVQGLRLDVDSSCPVVINYFGDPQCSVATTSDSTTTGAAESDTVAIIGGVVAVIVVVAVTVIIVALIAGFVTRGHRAKFSVHQDAR